MNTTYTEKESSKKKYLVPLVVIMLCLVAFTGAAYAYSTSVKGNGDISGNYVALDMYVDGGDQADPRYTATADLDISSNSFTVTTVRGNTVGTTTSYTANVEAGELKYKTILHINTNLDASTKFYLQKPEKEYVAPTGTETVKPGTLTLGDLKVESVVGSTTGSLNPTKEGGSEYELNSTEYYTITFTIAITAGVYGTYSSLGDLEDSIALFNDTASTKELQVTFTATTEPTEKTTE